ncbi:MAG: putative manganese-dependent inorganic diphosphatase [Treponema sp.]|jgi:manganese-dependent inorganic pyrophosphatase|nr:putative manganese-dependent inorganic diphosphatase [Treponema sp.]
MDEEKTVYVIGHRNPDTDSVASAAAYAALKQAQGMRSCRAARAGNLSPQTEYIFERFGVSVPEYLPDLVPKALHYISGPVVTIPAEASLWEALERMQRTIPEENPRVLPITDADGKYRGMFHNRGFANYITANINPHKKSAFPVSMDLLIRTLRAQPVAVFNGAEVKLSPIVVAAEPDDYFMAHLEDGSPEDSLVIAGDRKEIQRHCIERKVRALILSNGHDVDDDIKALAEKNRVPVIVSPYDTSSTAMLIIYSVPVGAIGDASVPLVNTSDHIHRIRGPISHAPSRCLPVGDDEGRVTGILFEGDLIKEPNVELILVDHNEFSQAVEGAENYHIREVIDHHRIGAFSTRYPITFINRVVGATCTIIAGLYREQNAPLKKEIASILLCGILADTLGLKSATATAADREAADFLASAAGLEIAALARDIQAAANRVNERPAGELTAMDMKEYTERGVTFSVSQVETDNPQSLLDRKNEIISALEKTCASKNHLFSALLVTDVLALDSFLFISGKKSFMGQVLIPRNEDGVYLLKGVVSRKKQLMPLLSELVMNMG